MPRRQPAAIGFAITVALTAIVAPCSMASAHSGAGQGTTQDAGEPQESPATAKALGRQAAERASAGDVAGALPLAAQALRLRRESLGDQHPDTIASLVSYGALLREAGRLKDAQPVLEEALRTSTATLGERHTDRLEALSAYGMMLVALGRAVEAEPLLAEALTLRREVLGEEHPDTISGLNNYAFVLTGLGRHAEAERIYREALTLRRKVLGERHPSTLLSLNNHASALMALGRLAEAEPLLSEALQAKREVLGDRHPETITSLNNYAVLLSRLDRNAEAEPLLAEVLRLNRETLGESHPKTLTSLVSHAAQLTFLDREAEAEPLYAEALRLRREALGSSHPDTRDALFYHAASLQRLGRIEEALARSRELAQGSAARLAALSDEGLRGEGQRDRELGSRQLTGRFHADVLWDNFAASDRRSDLAFEALTALQLASAGTTSRVVADAAAARFAAGAGFTGLVDERRERVQRWSRLAAALVEAQAGGQDAARQREDLRAELAAIEARIDAIDAELAAGAPEYFAILSQPSVTLDSLRASIGEDEAVLLLVPTVFGTHSMAVTRQTIRWERAAIDSDGIGAAVASMREGLRIEEGNLLPEFDLEQAYLLYKVLIAPVEEALAGKSRVYVVADGALSQLPLGTLVTSVQTEGAVSDDPEVLRRAAWLADRYALVQLPSLQSLVHIRTFGAVPPAGDSSGFLGFGDPKLEGKARLRGAGSPMLAPVDAADLVKARRGDSGAALMDPAALRRLAALPGTRAELVRVRDALGAPDAALYLAERMTETALRNADLSATRILHIASHGFSSEESGNLAEPGLVFTPPAAASAGDDGYLSASEVVGLDLRLADWVILSACNTALPSGRTGETGLSGLAQSFFYAGAKSLLVSHWPVFDDVAPLLTVGTLKRVKNGQPRAEALQAVMREIRNDPALDAAHPAVWAPFTLVGEGR